MLLCKHRFIIGSRYMQIRRGIKAERKTSALLVPFEFLTEKEKSSTMNSATEMIRTVLYLGYKFEKNPHLVPGSSKTLYARN